VTWDAIPPPAQVTNLRLEGQISAALNAKVVHVRKLVIQRSLRG